MNDNTVPPAANGPGDSISELDDDTVDDLAALLDARDRGAQAPGDVSPEHRLALDSLDRLRALAPELLRADTAAEPAPTEGWVRQILSAIAHDARPGRRIPIEVDGVAADLGITEGAVRGVIRGAESAVPGVLVGRCRIEGDVTTPGAEIRVHVELSVLYGEPIGGAATRLRTEMVRRLAAHTQLRVVGIDIAVRDVQLPERMKEER